MFHLSIFAIFCLVHSAFLCEPSEKKWRGEWKISHDYSYLKVDVFFLIFDYQKLFDRIGFHSISGLSELYEKCEQRKEKYVYAVYDGKYKNRVLTFGLLINPNIRQFSGLYFRKFSLKIAENIFIMLKLCLTIMKISFKKPLFVFCYLHKNVKLAMVHLQCKNQKQY